ncbi:MAG: MBL fold metallo-hydrolase [Sphingomonadales bacterium]|nr:MBL fold metallo-hydrolase [Sphingomonadales bacterium]
MTRLLALVLLLCGLGVALPAAAAEHRVQALRVTVLSTMLADEGIGEWGFAALVEADGERLLFDTGANPDTVLRNAKALGIDLAHVRHLVLSHFHDDHTGGLPTLRRALMGTDPQALAVADAGKGILEPRFDAQGKPLAGFPGLLAEYRALGGRVVEHDGPVELLPGVWLTGPVARRHDERNWNKGAMLRRGGALVEDTLAEDSSLVIRTADGLVILTGCAHAGIMNIADAAREIGGGEPIVAVIGGLHLFAKPEPVLAETAAYLKGVRYLLAAHCTGIEATFRLRQLLGLTPRTAVVAAVGSRYEAGKGGAVGGIAAGAIAGYAGL